jgi:multiple sugar transport system permease protein
MSTAIRRISGTFMTYLLLLILAAVFVLPFWWILSTSLKAEGEIFLYPPSWFPKERIHWENYVEVISHMRFGLFTWNSFKISALAMIGQLVSCSMAAFVFARMQFPGKNVIFVILLSTLMIPPQVTMIPTFLLMKSFGLVNTHAALYLPNFFANAFGIFLLRQFFISLPKEFEESAKIDGSTMFGIYWRIFLPLAAPALATLAIFAFMGQWNDLTGPIIYLSSSEKMTLTVGLSYFQGQFVSRWHWMMAGTVISIVPLLIIYLFFQRYFVAGIVSSGVKG